MIILCFFFFFFQAEDGIRDVAVTGVQTCALPILRVTASAEDGEIMAVQHTRHPVTGLQFHPESVLTEYGYVLVDRFLHGVAGRVRGLPRPADGGGGAGAAPPRPPKPPPPPPPPPPARRA